MTTSNKMVGSKRRSSEEPQGTRWQGAIAALALIVLAPFLVLAFAIAFVDLTRPRDGEVAGLSEIVDLTKALIWPVALLIVISTFYAPILKFLERLSKVTLKAGDAEATLEAQEKQARVSSLIGAAEASTLATIRAPSVGIASALFLTEPSTLAASPGSVADAASSIASAVNERTLPKLARAALLWVDDRPNNNAYLIQAFRELGMRVDTVTSTDQALQYLDTFAGYNVLITDMGRPPDPEAGYTLLRALRERRSHIPVIVYAGSDSEEYRKKAIEAGAIESTNRPQRVFNLVTSIVENAW